jgi:tetratricopeptide (TPR) repeat protein
VAQVRDGNNLPEGLPPLASLIAHQRPAQAGFYIDLAEAYRAVGDSARAIRSYQDALTRSPDSPVILLKLTNPLIEAREWTKAEAMLRRVVARAPADAVAWGLLGWALWQQEKQTDGRAALVKAIQLDPDAPELQNYLGSLLLGSGDRAGALRFFREAVRMETGIAEWRANLAGLLASMGQAAEARYHFEQSIRFKPGYAAGRFEYARFLAAAGDVEQAEKHARAAADLAPAMAEAHELYGA